MPPQKHRILVVNDMLDNVELLRLLLEMEGYEVETALGGEECLKKVYCCPPDLLLLDLMMPGMDGGEILRRIRSDAQLPHFPVLLVSASDITHADQLSMGADDFVRKPIDPDELEEHVRVLLARFKDT